MSEQHPQEPAAQGLQQGSFEDRVDRSLAMVMEYPEIQELAAVVKRIYADRVKERTPCDPTQQPKT